MAAVHQDDERTVSHAFEIIGSDLDRLDDRVKGAVLEIKGLIERKRLVLGEGETAAVRAADDMIRKSYLDLLNSLFNTEEGISEEARNLLHDHCVLWCENFFHFVEATDGRFYVKEEITWARIS